MFKLLALLFFLLAGSCVNAWAAANWHRSAWINLDVKSNGSFTSEETWEVSADNPTMAQKIAQQSFSWSEQLETDQIIEAWTQKEDGRKIPVDLERGVVHQNVGVVEMYPSFSDWQTRTIIFPQVSQGDRVHYRLLKTSKTSIFPGMFFITYNIANVSNAGDANIQLTIPRSLSLKHDSVGLSVTEDSIQEDTRKIVWKRTRKNEAIFLDLSTAEDYRAIGDAYARDAWPVEQPSLTLEKLALDIIGNEKNSHHQAQLIYEWVARNIRYVGFQIGRGRVVPHRADETVKLGYGDCKDHAALLISLLRAVGIDAIDVMTAMGAGVELDSVPNLLALDHVIVWIPEWNLFLDSTSPFATFGSLPLVDIDKPAVFASRAGSWVGRTSILDGEHNIFKIITIVKIAENGSASIQTSESAQGPVLAMLRQIATQIDTEGKEEAFADLIKKNGINGLGGFSYGDPYAINDNFSISSNIRVNEILINKGDSFVFNLPQSLSKMDASGMYFLSKDIKSGALLCYSGRQEEEFHIYLPSWAGAVSLPQSQQLGGDTVWFSVVYQQQGNRVDVVRNLNVSSAHAVCSSKDLEKVKAIFGSFDATKRIQFSIQSTKSQF